MATDKYNPNEKLMSIDVLNINLSLVETKQAKSYCSGNGRRGCVVMNHIYLIYTTIGLPRGAGRPSALCRAPMRSM